MVGPSVIEWVYYFGGVAAIMGIYRVLTTYRWHYTFHTDRARRMMSGRVICVHCVREWIKCPDCGVKPCLCNPRAEAQAWVRAQEAGRV